MGAADGSAHDAALAELESTFRDANENVYALAVELNADRPIPFICECPRRDCTKIVWLPLEDYDRVRADPTQFLYAAGHEEGLANSVAVDTMIGVLIVRKIGAAAEAARLTDPRS